MQNLNAGFRVGVLNGLHDVVSLEVGFGIDAVSDLQGEEAEPHTRVVGTGSQPVHPMATRQQPAFRGFPETYMVTLLGVAVYLLLVGEGLRPAENFERGDRRLRVGAAGHGGENNLPGGD